MNKTITVDQMIETDYKSYANYVIGNRAIPSMVDGLKPVQRKLLCAALSTATTKKIKVAELGGSLASYNYQHGETSAQAAAIGMATTYSNNTPLFEGFGNFGSRLVPEAAAPRYIYTKLHKNYSTWFDDYDIAPESPDPEDPEPLHYVPKIPWVLVNGTRGIAVGFATLILPRDPKAIAKQCKNYLTNKKVKHIEPTYPEFNGTWEKEQGTSRWFATGTFLAEKGGYRISELPPGVDREKYITFLNGLIEKQVIKSYTDDCRDTFSFFLRTTPSQKKVIEKKGPESVFKLTAAFTENITVLDEFGKLKVYESETKLIEDFCEYRLTLFKKRRDADADKLAQKIKDDSEMLAFVTDIYDNRSVALEGSKNDLLLRAQRHSQSDSMQRRMVETPIYKFCSETIQRLSDSLKSDQNSLDAIRLQDPKQMFIDSL